MVLKIQHFVIITTLLCVISCTESPSTLTKIAATQITIDSTLAKVATIIDFTAPYRVRINQVLDSALAYAPKPFSKTDGRYNTSAGNLLADLVMVQADPIF